MPRKPIAESVTTAEPVTNSAPVYVYIVECADGTLYTGWTTDLPRRVKVHNAGRGAKYTRQHGPVRLVYWETVANRGAALQRENAIKQMGTGKKRQLAYSLPEQPGVPAVET